MGPWIPTYRQLPIRSSSKPVPRHLFSGSLQSWFWSPPFFRISHTLPFRWDSSPCIIRWYNGFDLMGRQMTLSMFIWCDKDRCDQQQSVSLLGLKQVQETWEQTLKRWLEDKLYRFCQESLVFNKTFLLLVHIWCRVHLSMLNIEEHFVDDALKWMDITWYFFGLTKNLTWVEPFSWNFCQMFFYWQHFNFYYFHFFCRKIETDERLLHSGYN